MELIEGIAERNPPDYLGEDTRLATSLVYALHATQRRDLLNRLAEWPIETTHLFSARRHPRRTVGSATCH